MWARQGWLGSASRAKVVLGVEPPLMAIRARPGACTASLAISRKYCAARRARAVGSASTYYLIFSFRGIERGSPLPLSYTDAQPCRNRGPFSPLRLDTHFRELMP